MIGRLDSLPVPSYNAGVTTPMITIPGEPVLYSDQQLHGMYFAPRAAVRATVLLVSPLFEEKRCAHRALTTCARALAAAGVAVLQPDLYGTGNSRGALTEIALERWLDDLHAAMDALRDRTQQQEVTVIGCRAGALLTAHAIAEGLTATRLVLLQPVVSGRGYLNQLRTRRMIQDKMTGEAPPDVGAHEVEGHELSPALSADLQGLRLPAEMPELPISLLQCSFTDKLLTEYGRVLQQWGTERVQTRSIVCEPFWHPHSPGDYAELTHAIVEEVCA